MGRGTKRKHRDLDASGPTALSPPNRGSPVRRDLLERCYTDVRTLREHVLLKLPSSSRLRRKKIATLGQRDTCSEIETTLARLLDTALVCSHQPHPEVQDTRWEQWLSFSQKGDESCVTISDISASIYSQSEIVDFVIWLLFSRKKKANARPKHILCDGYRRKAGDRDQVGTGIPDIFSLHHNSPATALREMPWPHLLALLGQSGEKIMIDLLLDCSVFVQIESGYQNYYQMSGNPLSEVGSSGSTVNPNKKRKSSDITLVRSRIFYAKPALTARGLVQPGFKHIHVLNRCPYVQHTPFSEGVGNLQVSTIPLRNETNTTKVMMYIFPKQFGLHNVFTSKVNTMQTTQKHQDYTLREEEIAAISCGDKDSTERRLPKLPRRLRGEARRLTERLQILHVRCSYVELLRHHCPSALDRRARRVKPKRGTHHGLSHPSQTTATVPSQPRPRYKKNYSKITLASSPWDSLPRTGSLVELASSHAQISAFCQAVLCQIIPSDFWGEGDTKNHNLMVFLRKVDHFIKLRRFESMSFHEISQDFKVAEVNWLRPPGLDSNKLSQTDTNKRLEIFHEFLYYVFDSLLIPLIRSNFYITESNTHRYQVFYFRHDVWRLISEASMAEVKGDMLEEVKLDDAVKILESRRLGFSQIRLLPKGNKLRPIMNLRKRTLGRGVSKVLGPSINSVLTPVHTLLKLEKDINPSKLGATMFSVSDIYARLKSFKQEIGLSASGQKLYFAKVDVRAAFDTIPQAAVVELMESVPSQTQYTITKHAEVKPGERAVMDSDKTAAKPIRRWHATALADGSPQGFAERLDHHMGAKKKNTVFIDSAVQHTHEAEALLGLLAEHVEQNLIKVGKKYYRQKRGIPQGSVLSSFLCNYCYADLELRHLEFLQAPDCLLLRLVDDFLLVTLDKSKARRFVEAMHGGMPEYGVEVNPMKTLVNFNMEMDDGQVCKLTDGNEFPYCGTLINCASLEISKDRNRDKGIGVSNSLTVEFGRAPGQNFQRKTLNAFKIQSHLMFFDTAHNSTATVLASLRGALIETACKMCAYIRCLPRPKRPSSSLIVRTITKLITVAFLLLTGKSRKMRYIQYTCDVRKDQVSLIAYSAFIEVLTRRQTMYGGVMTWLRREAAELAP